MLNETSREQRLLYNSQGRIAPTWALCQACRFNSQRLGSHLTEPVAPSTQPCYNAGAKKHILIIIFVVHLLTFPNHAI
jgi:hypothetical protein